MSKKNEKLREILDVVIENYLDKGDPIGSKFLHTLEDIDYAPSTLRKYLNMLEQDGLVYQPYNSSGRIPTREGISSYIDHYIDQKNNNKNELALLDMDTEMARNNLRYLVEKIGDIADGVVTGFLANDEYYYLGINNLLKKGSDDIETTKHIIDFIEKKEIVPLLGEKMIKQGQVYYTFIDQGKTVMSCVYGKIHCNGYEAVLSILGPLRTNYKHNLAILKKIIQQYGQ